MRIDFRLALFRNRNVAIVGNRERALDRRNSERALLHLLDALVAIDRLQLQRNKLPPLYRSGVIYRREPTGSEVWKDAVNIYRDGYGDCEDLACYRIAELQNNGKKARPYIRFRIDPIAGIYIYHVMVLRSGDKLEDPSKVLGMKGQD